MNKYKMIVIKEHNISVLADLIQNLGKSKTTFRYYEKRELDVIKQHFCTYVIMYEGESVGYGHLEEENGILWLGIAIAENYTGLGLGKLMMKQLMDFAHQNNKKEIYLSVDKNNKIAISLYEKFGFFLVKELNSNVLLLNYKDD